MSRQAGYTHTDESKRRISESQKARYAAMAMTVVDVECRGCGKAFKGERGLSMHLGWSRKCVKAASEAREGVGGKFHPDGMEEGERAAEGH